MLALAFAWAGGAKVLGFERWRTALAGYGLPSAFERPVAVLTPIAELVVAFVTIAVSARIGGLASLAMLGLFSLAILRARSVTGDRLPCGCFGGSSERHYSTMMLRNAALGILAAAVSFGDTDPSASFPAANDLFPAALALAGLALAGWVAVQTSRSLQRRSDR